MNERLELLAKQADLLGDFTPTRIDGRYVGYINVSDIEKFAELIVRECAKIANEPGARIPGYYIKKHFGVEE